MSDPSPAAHAPRAIPHTAPPVAEPASRLGRPAPRGAPRGATTWAAILTGLALASCSPAVEEARATSPAGTGPSASPAPTGSAAAPAASTGYVPIFEDPSFEDHPDVMTTVVGETRLSDQAIEIDPLQLMPADLNISEEDRAEIAAMLRALQPLDLSLTSDHHDRRYILNKMRMEALEQVEREQVGWAALHAYTHFESPQFHARSSLLRIGARVSPETAAPILEKLAFTYGPSLADRTEALTFLAEADPDRFLLGARPYLERLDRPFQTAPNDEFFVRGWIEAARRKGESPVPMMAQVATNFALEGIARYEAIEELRHHPDDPLARATLAEALRESTGDGLLRRKAAQSILAAFPAEDACSLLREVRSKEADVNMARFLDRMVQENCR